MFNELDLQILYTKNKLPPNIYPITRSMLFILLSSLLIVVSNFNGPNLKYSDSYQNCKLLLLY